MPGASRVNRDIVGAGVIIGPGAATVFVNNQPASLVGDLVAAHGSAPHTSATVVSGTSTVFIENRPITIQGESAASCGHTASTGSTDVFVE